jgi:uncharacterized protein (DUF362 family)/NAD-dependent dihydropyrimidine dehydrogenase PreA subunit
MVEKVVIDSCNNYSTVKIKEFISKSFEEINFKVVKSKVLLKPNLLSAKTPDKAVTTHPEFIRAISELLLDFSCDVYIGDSPGYESAEKVLLQSGIMNVIKCNGLKVRQFNMKVKKFQEGISPYREFVLGDDPDDYDLVVNIPKLKTHTMMGLTLGVKNTFGFIPGFDKAKWHLRAGRDITLFASLLIDIHNIVKPSLTIVDGIIGMDGDGPSNGRVRNLGIIGISKNAFILDHEIEKMVGLSYPLPISTLSLKHGLIGKYEVSSNPLLQNKFSDFQLPSTMNTDWNIPQVAKRILRGLFVKKPKINSNICKNCNVCVKVCPAGALLESQKKPVFDYKKCIRCYCCQEMCPEGAISVT